MTIIVINIVSNVILIVCAFYLYQKHDQLIAKIMELITLFHGVKPCRKQSNGHVLPKPKVVSLDDKELFDIEERELKKRQKEADSLL